MRNGIFRSTPFRVSLILGTTFLIALIIAGLVAFTLIERELDQRMDQSITDTFKVITESYGDSDQADLVDSVQSHARSALNHDQVYALVGPDGRIVSGNVAAVPAGTGWLRVPASVLSIGMPDNGEYRVFVGEIGGNRLLVGSSFDETREIARLTLTTLGWSSVAVLLVVVAIGSVMATRAQRRIDGIGQTMARVGHGELDARIVLRGRGDDIDMLARQVNAALERLGALVEGMRQVSVNIAHDLKTPLNRLAITIESASGAEALSQPIRPHLDQAELEIQQINSTFDALLRIAQIEAGARRARFVPVQLEEVLDKIADAYTDVADEGGQHLAVAYSGPLPEIDGDRELLTQLCANLVENSIRHCPPGTQIQISATRGSDRIVVTFSDDGPGIPPAEHGKVFQRLYRVDKSRTTPGTGLGLSLVKAIADLHSATVELRNREPGLSLSVAFPIPRGSQRTGV